MSTAGNGLSSRDLKQHGRVFEALALDYETQTRDRRLYAQSMMAAAGFIVASAAVLVAAWAQSGSLGPLVLVAPLMLAGGELVLVLRLHLLRVSVYLTLVEEDIRLALDSPTLPVAWETTMTGEIARVAQYASPARDAPGLSIKLLMVAGVLASVCFVGLGALALLADNVFTRSIARDLVALDRFWYAATYVIANAVLVVVITATWRQQTRTLTRARDHFMAVRSQVRQLDAHLASKVAAAPLGRQRSRFATIVAVFRARH